MTSTPTKRATVGKLLPIPFTLTVLVIGTSVFAQDESNSCVRSQVVNPPAFVTSVAWAENLQKFILLDGPSSLTYEMSLDGGIASMSPEGSVIVLENAGSDFLRIVRQVDDGRFRAQIQWLDSQFLQRSEAILEHAGVEFFPFEQALAGDSLLLFGSRSGSPTHTTGFFVTTIAPGKAASPDLILDYESDYYVLGWDLIAAHGESFFFLGLRPDHRPTLYRYDIRDPASLWPMEKLPFSEAAMPDLGLGQGMALGQFPKVFELIERFDELPVGLFAKGSSLLLLTRKRRGEGTAWKMTKFHPQGVEVVDLGSVTLPTRARHLLVAELPSRMVFLELGSVGFEKGRLIQTLESLVTVPDSWITNPQSSLLGHEGVLASLCDEAEQFQASRGGL